MIFGRNSRFDEEAGVAGTVELDGECSILNTAVGDDDEILRSALAGKFGTSWSDDGTATLPSGEEIALGTQLDVGGGFENIENIDSFVTDPDAVAQLQQCVGPDAAATSIFLIQHPIE